MKKIILVSCWLNVGIQILIPKQRGNGFLKVPCGHHHSEWQDDIEYDVDGLDGFLDIDCGYIGPGHGDLDEILREIMPVITKRFPFKWNLIDRYEFQKLIEPR